MPAFRITNLVDKTLSLDVDGFEDSETAIDAYIEEQDPSYYSVPEYESLRDNLLVEPID